MHLGASIMYWCYDWYNFFTRKQHQNESISDFIAQLRKLAHHCKFNDTLDDMLRDRLVCGCRDRRLQFKLLSDSKLTFAKALELAKADETAERGTKDRSGGPSLHRLVHSQRPKRRRPPNPPPQSSAPKPHSRSCSRCGAAHSPATCKYKDATCNYCQKKGHLASVCRTKARDQKGITNCKQTPRTTMQWPPT